MMIETSVAAAIEKASWVGEEDVDIGEEIPMEYYPPVEIEKDDNANSNNSSSSSSGSDDTSSSSGSDSGNSSDDNDSAHET
ncbi:hypothetical protein Q3G72_009509 [Acer saccharum]|nr:hypothetical protein Q3G72_009509 [Acer saccharum]